MNLMGGRVGYVKSSGSHLSQVGTMGVYWIDQSSHLGDLKQAMGVEARLLFVTTVKKREDREMKW